MLAEQRRRGNPWTTHRPDWPKRNEPQCRFLSLTCREAMYGGAAGGGKTDALLMAALQYVDRPNYTALLLRRTYQDLALPGAIMDRAHDWLRNSPAVWSQEIKRYTFPSGSSLTFGYLDTEAHKYRYQGTNFDFIGFDELTQFSQTQYTYVGHRLRRLEGSDIPPRIRSATNPGGIGHEWVKARFIDEGKDPDLVFVPSVLDDNPYLDQEEYRKSLEQLDAVTRAQLLNGNWDVMPEGNTFKRSWFGSALPDRPAFLTHWVRAWDMAATQDGGDYTTGVLIGRGGNLYYVLDVTRGRWSPGERNAVIKQTTQQDALVCPRYTVWVEQEPGSSGKESAFATITDLSGYDVHSAPSSGSKIVRANPFSAQCEVGNVKIILGTWNAEYINELCAFPQGPHDDQVDASAMAFSKLATATYETYSEQYA